MRWNIVFLRSVSIRDFASFWMVQALKAELTSIDWRLNWPALIWIKWIQETPSEVSQDLGPTRGSVTGAVDSKMLALDCSLSASDWVALVSRISEFAVKDTTEVTDQSSVLVFLNFSGLTIYVWSASVLANQPLIMKNGGQLVVSVE